MKRKVDRLRLAPMLLLDILMVAVEIDALSHYWDKWGVKMFIYYTQDSNILALAVCVVCIFAGIIALIRGRRMPGWTRKLRLCAAGCLMLTMLVAAFVIVPVDKKRTMSNFMFSGKYLYLHTVCPLVMLVQLYLHPGPRLKEKHALAALIPTVIYGGILLNLIQKGVCKAPYQFLDVRGQEMYITVMGCIAVLAIAYAAVRIMAALTCIGRRSKRQVVAKTPLRIEKNHV